MSVGAWDFLFNTAAGLLRIVPYTHTLGDLPKDKIEIEHLFEPHVSEALPIMLHQLLTSVTGKAQLATDIVQQATGLASSYLKLPKSSQLYLSDGKVSLITDLANCMFHFIIAHEFAHYLYEESSFVPQGGFGPIALQEAMKKFLHRSSIELEADNIASKLLIFRMHNLSIPVETAVASIGTFFLLTDLVYDCVHVLQTGYSAEGSVVHATHPPALGRAKHIMRVLPTDPQFPRLIKDFNQRFEKADLILQQLENVFSRVITPRILNWFSENRGKRSGGGTLRRIGSL